MKVVEFIRSIFFAALSGSMLLTAIAYSYSIGQISGYIKYGYNRQTREISGEFKDDDVVGVNSYGSGDLLASYRKDLCNDPEWRWSLKEWIPKKTLLKVHPQCNTYSLYILDMPRFKDLVEGYGVEKVVIVTSEIEGDAFSYEEYLSDLFVQTWLEYERRVDLKNKVMYVFNVKN